MILYRQLSQRWHPWISVTQFDANMSRGAFIRTIRWVTFVHRNCTESHSFRYLLSKRARPYKKDDNDEEAVLVRDSIYFIYFLHESLCFFFFLINKSLSGCLEGHSFCWLNRYDRLLIAFSLFGFEIKMFKMWICIWFILGPVFVARSNVNRFWWNSMHIYIYIYNLFRFIRIIHVLNFHYRFELWFLFISSILISPINVVFKNYFLYIM